MSDGDMLLSIVANDDAWLPVTCNRDHMLSMDDNNFGSIMNMESGFSTCSSDESKESEDILDGEIFEDRSMDGSSPSPRECSFSLSDSDSFGLMDDEDLNKTLESVSSPFILPDALYQGLSSEPAHISSNESESETSKSDNSSLEKISIHDNERTEIELELNGATDDIKKTLFHCVMEENGIVSDIKRNTLNKSSTARSFYRQTHVNYGNHSVHGHQTVRPLLQSTNHLTPSKPSSKSRRVKIIPFSSPSRDSEEENISIEESPPLHRVHELWSKETVPKRLSRADVMAKLVANPTTNIQDSMKAELRKIENEINELEQDYELNNKHLNQLETYFRHLRNKSFWEGTKNKNSYQRREIKHIQLSPIARQWGDLTNAVSKPSDSLKNKAKSVFTGSFQKKSNLIRSMRKQRGLYFSYNVWGMDRKIKSALSTFTAHSKKVSLSKNICNVALTGRSSYFISWDNQKWCHHGSIARHFYTRLAKKCLIDKCPNITYLAVGPESRPGANDNYYYADLDNDESWWTNFDEDFHEAIQNLPVQRVAFGTPYPGSNGKPSWIILGKDGRSAWKGIPTRLHNILSSRHPTLCAACEVSLGPSGSFFIKFLSGEIDYCLPAGMANKIESIEKRGGVITNVLLHADCNGVIIRHTETMRKRKN